MSVDKRIVNFVKESNKIEGIVCSPTTNEINTMIDFLDLPRVEVADLENFVNVYQPGAKLRRLVGMNVRVGNHYPPPGGPGIEIQLDHLLESVDSGIGDAYTAHVLYETLHPFQDGNGRSGRALWAWMMNQQYGMDGLRLGFLHMFYYQALEHSRD